MAYSSLIGARVKRKEDPRLITGAGAYVGDLKLPGMHHVVFVRSPYAHARIRGIDADAARRRPGVVAVLTGAEAAEHARPLRPYLKLPAFKSCGQPCLATDKVRLVGEAVAAVVAESRYLAE